MGRSLPSAELATQHPRDRTEHVAGLSPNPATNLLAADIAMRIGSQAMRHLAEKGMLSRRYGKGGADAIVSKRSLSASLAGYALTRVATRSVPGAVLVGGGLLAKTLFDRTRSKKASRRAGDKTLAKTTKE
ncbi:MAG: hypothetical protein DI591_07455 [Citromicrobium sp.]|nr:MAG: hypothetical protein DI591_07455 [Citromicrobium sp.]